MDACYDMDGLDIQHNPSMGLAEYQLAAMTTCVIDNDEAKVQYGVLNTASEAGEIAGKYAKALRDNNNINTEEVIKEMGDVLWSLACLADGLGVDLETVARTNLSKLASRKDRDVIGGSGDNR